MKINSHALGLTVGTLAGCFWFLGMGFSLLTGIGYRTIELLGGLHPFYQYSFWGLIIIVIEHLIGGYILGWLLGWLYNNFLPRQ